MFKLFEPCAELDVMHQALHRVTKSVICVFYSKCINTQKKKKKQA